MKIYHPIFIGALLTSLGSWAQIVSYDQSTGRPTQVDKNNAATTALQQRIFQAFKDDLNLSESNVAVYKSPTEIKVLKESVLYITYINEETAGTGTLAYFTYKTGTDPDATSKAALKPIFPRVNNTVLAYGDMVAIGPFIPGTSVGFALIKNGWVGNTITYAGNKVYTTDTPKAVASALDPETGMVILGFEEKMASDIKDLNDVLIGIQASEKSALKTQSFAGLTTTTPVSQPQEQSTPVATERPATATTSNAYGCFDNGMPEETYNANLRTIRSTNDDVNRIKIIKASVEGTKITPEQAKNFCLLLSNYSHRYEMAKYLFEYECEKDRATILSETFKNTSYERNYLSFVAEKLKYEKSHTTKNNQQQTASTPAPAPAPQNQTVIIVDPNTGYGQQGHPRSYPQRGIPFSPAEMDHLLAQMNNATFDSNMDDLVRAAVINRVLSTYQVRQILSEFSFDNYRLSISKYLYDFTYDTHVYYTLSSTFTFSKSQKDFLDYVRSRGNRVY